MSVAIETLSALGLVSRRGARAAVRRAARDLGHHLRALRGRSPAPGGAGAARPATGPGCTYSAPSSTRTGSCCAGCSSRPRRTARPRRGRCTGRRRPSRCGTTTAPPTPLRAGAGCRVTTCAATPRSSRPCRPRPPSSTSRPTRSASRSKLALGSGWGGRRRRGCRGAGGCGRSSRSGRRCRGCGRGCGGWSRRGWCRRGRRCRGRRGGGGCVRIGLGLLLSGLALALVALALSFALVVLAALGLFVAGLFVAGLLALLALGLVALALLVAWPWSSSPGAVMSGAPSPSSSACDVVERRRWARRPRRRRAAPAPRRG